jgi:hypothetical protein
MLTYQMEFPSLIYQRDIIQDYVPTEDELDKALKGSKTKCKVLLLTNPSNPLGIVFSRYANIMQSRSHVARVTGVRQCGTFPLSPPQGGHGAHRVVGTGP